ncbi:MAG: opacity family porin [Gemmatimonadaceae bacterium]|jgi:hypothetical protein|nr:opacity family porin [Gemmatimonadaceae bacterium]
MTDLLRRVHPAVRLFSATAVTLMLMPATVRAQDFEFEDEPAKRSVGLVLGAQQAMSDLKTLTERGLAFGVMARQPIKGSRLLSLRLDADLGTFSQNKNTPPGGTAGSGEYETRFTSFRGLLGAQVTADNETFRPYLHAGAGVGLAQARLSPLSANISEESTSGVGLAWMAGVGVYRLIGESDREWALDVGARLNGMPTIDQPSVIRGQTQFTTSRRPGTAASWSFMIGVHVSL